MTATTTDPTIWLPQPEPLRDDHGHWTEHPDTARRDAAVLEQIDAGHSFRSAAATLGYASPASTFTAYRRALARSGRRPTRRPTRGDVPACPACGDTRATATATA